MAEEEYQLKRGDIVSDANGEVRVVAGWIDENAVCILNLDEKKIIVEYASEVALLAKADELDKLLPKQIKLSHSQPKQS